jgi:hypothetical protein
MLEVTLALLFPAQLPKTYWSDAVLTACYLINRLPSRILNFQCPMEILYNRKFGISHLRVFGCVCYVHLQTVGKLDQHARRCIFVGYCSTKKGYKCYDPQLRKTYISRDVRFDKTHMFYEIENQGEGTTYDDFQITYPLNADYESGIDLSRTKGDCSSSKPIVIAAPESDVVPSATPNTTAPDSVVLESSADTSIEIDHSSTQQPSTPVLRRTSREIRPLHISKIL